MNKSKWHEENKVRQREYLREWNRKQREADPVAYAAKKAASQKKDREKFSERRKARDRARYHGVKWEKTLCGKYGVEPGWYDAQLTAQGGKCAICPATEPGGKYNTRFHVDHCHTTGKVRGLLCNSCNHLLGQSGDRPATLRSAAEYLTKYTTPF